jgi:serine/threonine-protein kinase
MGVVYKARQRDLDRLVALKMILSSQLASEELIARFHAEARSAARLAHRHVVQVFETGEVHGQHFYAMEYVEGQSLESLLRSRRLEVEEALHILLPIARAVGYLHAHEVVHRDLKPGNILIDRTGRPVLTDFGLAKCLSSDSKLTSTGAIMGTPSYMSPEQASGRPVGPAADVYALGTILYECLTSRPPFLAGNPLDVLVQVIELEPPAPRQLRPDLPRNLELVVLKCLEKDAGRRYQHADELADDLERFLHGEAVTAQPLGILGRLIRWARREPNLAAHLGAIGLSGIVSEIGYRLAGGLTATQHAVVLGTLAVWAVLAFLLQRHSAHARWGRWVPFAWASLDVSLLTVALGAARGITGPLVACYPLYIVATGLWFRDRLVWFATAASILGCLALYVHAALAGVRLEHPSRHVILQLILVLIGLVVSYQVRRIRVLTRQQPTMPGG